MRIEALSCLLALLTAAPIVGRSQVAYRKYREGDIYRYRLTTERTSSDQPSKDIYVSEHRVVKENGVLGEEIKWVSSLSVTQRGEEHLDSIARLVKPYFISLSPNGSVPLPKLTVRSMVGPVTDLNTFFVAIAPACEAQKLSKKHPVIYNKAVREGNFADSVYILYGRDCIRVSQHFISTDKQFTTIRTDFTPPDSFCLTPLLDVVARKTFDKPNNFQMVQVGAPGSRNLMWGVESFSITSKIDKETGMLVEAVMDNTLNLRFRMNATPDLKTYKAEVPLTIKRKLHLELLQ